MVGIFNPKNEVNSWRNRNEEYDACTSDLYDFGKDLCSMSLLNYVVSISSSCIASSHTPPFDLACTNPLLVSIITLSLLRIFN